MEVIIIPLCYKNKVVNIKVWLNKAARKSHPGPNTHPGPAPFKDSISALQEAILEPNPPKESKADIQDSKIIKDHHLTEPQH